MIVKILGKSPRTPLHLNILSFRKYLGVARFYIMKGELSSMTSKKQMMMKFTCSDILREHFLGKFINFFNRIFEKQYSGKIYLEEIHEGFIAFCKDKETFNLLFFPYPPKIVEDLKKSPLKQNFILEDNITESDFKRELFYFNLEFLNTDAQLFVPMISNLYGQLNGKSIKVDCVPPHITVRFENWESFKLYSDLLAQTYNNMAL